MTFDREYTLHFLLDLLNIDSPSGFTRQAVDFLEQEAKALGCEFRRSRQGGAILHIPGRESGKTIGYCAHVDTLGLMVRSIKPDGRLAVTNIGGPIIPTLDGEYCRIYTREGKVYTGTILYKGASVHVYKDSRDGAREIQNMEIRIDEKVKTAEETRALGICAGDYICFEQKAKITPSGFIKSRFLDDKLSVAALYGVVQAMRTSDLRPRYDTWILCTVFEEVGHGMSYLPADMDELLGVDMGCVGDDLTCDEYSVSICAKDSAGPFDYDMTSRLIALAKAESLQYAVDIYPYYSSDVAVALRSGHDLCGALIGAGVHASHGMERSHYEGLENTMKLIAAYMELA